MQATAIAGLERGTSLSAIRGHSAFHAGALLALGLLWWAALTNDPKPWMIYSILGSLGAFVAGSILLLCTKIWETSKVRSFVNSTGFYVMTSGLITFLILSMIAGSHLFHTGMWVLFGVYFFGTVFGITAGYHRWATHEAFEASPWFIRTMLFFGAMACQKAVDWWRAIHLMHHVWTEIVGKDPHTPKEGVWLAHMFWVWFPYLYPDALWQRFTKGSHPLIKEQLRYQRFAMWFGLWSAPAIFFLWALIAEASLLQAVVEAVKAFLLVGTLRIVLVYHTTFLVTGAAHAWGSRRYASSRGGESRDLWFWLLVILTLGEILHAIHHRFPNAAYYGVKWYYLDLTGLILLFLAQVQRMVPWMSLGLPYNLTRIPKERL